MDSQIFQVIDELEDYISNCKGKFMSSTEIICNREKLEEFLRDLRRKAPEEINKCQKIIARQEAILSDAKTRAQKLIDDSMTQSDQLISQNEIMRRAYEEADKIVLVANQQAQAAVDGAIIESNNFRSSANQYAEDVMVYLENFFDNSLRELNDHYNAIFNQYTALSNALNAYAENIREDHKQLHPEEQPQAAPAPEPVAAAQAGEQ
ncbi:MAG: vacuolar family H+-ATPase subunit H [Lachnospiraceae bacterium]|nr:vacuolar family H+-ATPase subunit H [Lachnospiraceae bacterium]